jgi:hypothetical protein
MALVSPGVEVTIIDQSQYLPSSANSVPFVLLATAQNKSDGSGTAVASATTKANANKLYQVTSQRDLVTLFGNPFFYKTTNGTPIHGYELNEYGLMAAYSLLGTTNNCYVLRADVDLAGLVGHVTRPSGEPADGSYWLDTTNSSWGIYEFNATTGKFIAKTPILVSDMDMQGGVPLASIGNKGDYAVLPAQSTGGILSQSTYFFKSPLINSWVALGSTDWKKTISTVKGTITSSPYTLPAGTLTFDVAGQFTRTITVTSGQTVTDLATAINALEIQELTATGSSGVLNIYFSRYGVNSALTITDSSTILSTLNLDPDPTTNSIVRYAPDIQYGTSSQMPLWTASQAKPHPTGSVWIKISSAGSGINLIMSKYSAVSGLWSNVTTPIYPSNAVAIYSLDSSGGKAIPEGTLYANLNARLLNPDSGLSIFKRTSTGPTVAVSANSDASGGISFASGLHLTVTITVPGSYTPVTYGFTTTPANGVSGNGNAASFVRDWTNVAIPYTTAMVTDAGAIELTHTLGGEITLNDRNSTNMSNGLLSELGFVAGASGVKQGAPYVFTNTTSHQYKIKRNGIDITGSWSGTPGSFVLSSSGNQYSVTQPTSGGTGLGYHVGDLVVFAGSTFGGTDGDNDLTISIQAVGGSGQATKIALYSGMVSSDTFYNVQISNWDLISYTASTTAPATKPAADTRWFFSVVDQVDIMVLKNGAWKGYRNVEFDSAGHPASSTTDAGMTDMAGPIVSATTPTTQSDGTSALVYGDLWIDTSDLENYPLINRWESVDNVDQWVRLDNTDQTSSSGVLFADARWGASGVDPVMDAIPSISSLLTVDHVDLDCPSPSLYPQGMLLLTHAVQVIMLSNTRPTILMVWTSQDNHYLLFHIHG